MRNRYSGAPHLRHIRQENRVLQPFVSRQVGTGALERHGHFLTQVLNSSDALRHLCEVVAAEGKDDLSAEGPIIGRPLTRYPIR